jgi:hypothetical protein
MMNVYNSQMNVYNSQNNSFLKEAKNLVPRTITYGGEVAFGLVDKRNKNRYYCFLSKYGITDRERVCPGDVTSELSLTDYFNASRRLLALKLKLNLKKIIYDSSRNK